MGEISLQQAAAWCGGYVEPQYRELTFRGANFDSRKLQPGQLFVALTAARDGHDFIPGALEKGASAVLCTRMAGQYPAILVEDTRIALGQIAKGYLQHIGAKAVGVTGSVGKSTTKEMIACVLGTQYRVAKTPANHNNDLGMPAAILDMPADTQLAVLEMGMSHFGEIAYLSHIGTPEAAVIINVGTMHIENLGSREGILQAKLEITQGMPENGKLFLCGDSDLLWESRNALTVQSQYFGWENEACPVKARSVAQREQGLYLEAVTPRGTFPITLPVEGRHFVTDALAAVAVGEYFGIRQENIQAALGAFQNMQGRQEIFQCRGVTVISDCYNAGPESMAAALEVLGNRTGRRIAVLGDMLELGNYSQKAHETVGALAAQKADVLLTYGERSLAMAQSAREKGLSQVQSYLDRDEMTKDLKKLAKPGDTVLFKGSNGMHLDLCVKSFIQKEA